MQFMQEYGPQPNLRTYNTLLHCCAKCGQAHTAEDLLKAMRECGITPDSMSYSAVLHACANATEVGRAQRVLRSMEDYGLKPDLKCCTSVMSACVNEGSPSSLRLVRLTLKRLSQTHPLFIIFNNNNALFSGSTRSNVRERMGQWCSSVSIRQSIPLSVHCSGSDTQMPHNLQGGGPNVLPKGMMFSCNNALQRAGAQHAEAHEAKRPGPGRQSLHTGPDRV